jgi:hypothetical protein
MTLIEEDYDKSQDSRGRERTAISPNLEICIFSESKCIYWKLY